MLDGLWTKVLNEVETRKEWIYGGGDRVLVISDRRWWMDYGGRDWGTGVKMGGGSGL